MAAKPQRPVASAKVLDYDDGDPYSCIAAGAHEDRLQKALTEKVRACYGRPDEVLDKLAAPDLASVKTALYDLWDHSRSSGERRELGDWAARQMSRLGDSGLLDYDARQGQV